MDNVHRVSPVKSPNTTNLVDEVQMQQLIKSLYSGCSPALANRYHTMFWQVKFILYGTLKQVDAGAKYIKIGWLSIF